ncbi:MAG: Alpha/beta hydrolase fold [bacterium]|nr:Alpha/beta hydrolase fold [bacterium]
MRRLRIGDPNDSRSLRVRDEGESRRPPLVCVHGAGSSSVVWMDVVRRLSPQRRVVAPDLPGHGQSDRWHAPDDVTIAMYRDAVGTVCAQLEIERAVLMGHSMGALIALDAAAAWPERVAGLVLVNGGARLPVAPEVFVKLTGDFARFGKWLSRVIWSPSTPLDVVERWGSVAFTADQEITLADFRAVDRFDGMALGTRVRAPTLVLGGADDLMTPPALTRELAASIAGARAVVVPEAGHMLMQEQPERFFAELESFLITST